MTVPERPLRDALEDYLALRRALGFKLAAPARLLGQFTGYLEARGTSTITISGALAWATLPAGASPAWPATRPGAVRGFAACLHGADPSVQVPPAGLIRRGNDRATPYLYSDAEISAIINAAGTLRPQLRAATYQTLISLLAVSGLGEGLRIGEAMRLDRDDIDWDEKVLVVRSSKFGRSREVVCHDSTIGALRTYSARRDQLCPRPASASFFVSQRGRRLAHHGVYAAFHQLAGEAGQLQRPGGRPPRVHGLRH